MGKKEMPAQSSLDRLKGLARLKNHEQQIAEAQQLCNHSARAEMILRWLLETTSKTSEFQTSANAWNLLSSCIRILPERRAAALLGQYGFVKVFATACAEPKQSEATVSAMASCLKLLMTLGDSEGGAALKSLLIIRDEKAAVICGDWFRHVHDSISQVGAQALINGGLIEPGVYLWNLRTRLESDRELFNKHCLAPIMLLLVSLRHSTVSSSIKRKRDDSISPTANACVRSLESLVATNFIIPVRDAFAKDSTGQTNAAREYDPEAAQLRMQFEPMSKAMSQGPTEEWASVPPLLMDIALRSVSMPTPRHRQNERPWFEALFMALHGCVHRTHRTRSAAVLAEILDVIYRKQMVLSPWVLQVLVQNFALSAQESSREADWALIAKICALDPHPLTETDIITAIFDAITSTEMSETIAVRKQSTSEVSPTSFGSQIIVPLLGAFNKSRNLVSFFNAWYSQLRRAFSSSRDFVWSSIISDVASVIAQSLSHEQISGLFELHRKALSDSVGSGERTDTEAEEVYCSLILLNALVSGLRSEVLAQSMKEEVEWLYEILLTRGDTSSFLQLPKLRLEYISLLDTVFRIQFSSWIAQQEQDAAVESLAVRLLASSALTVLKQPDAESERTCQGIDIDSSDRSISLIKSQCLATIYEAFQPYQRLEECAKLCKWLLKRIDFGHRSATRLIIQHTSILGALKSAERHDLVRTLLRLATDTTPDSQPVLQSSIEAIVDVLRMQTDPQELEDTVRILVQHLKDTLTGQSAGRCEALILSILDSIPLSRLQSDSRRDIADALTARSYLPPASQGMVLFKQRLAFLAKLVQTGCDQAQLLTKGSTLWQTIGGQPKKSSGKSASSVSSFAESPAVLDQVSTLTRAVFTHWTKSQTGDHGRAMLEEQSKLLQAMIEKAHEDVSGKSPLDVRQVEAVGVAIATIERGTRFHPSEKLPHQEPDVLSSILGASLQRADRLSLLVSGHKSPLILSNDAMATFNAAAKILRSAARHLPNEGHDQEREISDIAKRILQQQSDGPVEDLYQDTVSEERQGRQVSSCYRTLCDYAVDDVHAFTDISLHVLQRSLNARACATILSSFEATVKRNSTAWKKDVALKLLNDDPHTLHARLLLQGLIASQTSKEVSEADENRTAQRLVQYAISSVYKETKDPRCAHAALQTMAMILKDKPFLITQSVLEEAVSALHKATSDHANVAFLFLDICRVLTILLAHHRSRLQGRFHLVVVMFQDLISCTAIDHRDAGKELAVRQAQTLGRLLALFCDPPLVRHRSKSSGLVDEARKEKAYVGQYVPYILHHYCNQVLATSMRQEIREALTPGVWAMIEAMEVNSNEGIRVLSAEMNNSERSVLRTVYEDWKRFGKWEGI